MAPLAALAAATDLGPDSPLRLRRGLRAEVSADAESVRLRLIDTTIRFPVAAETALKIVLDGAVFTPDELPGLDPDERLILCRRLLREGIAVPA